MKTTAEDTMDAYVLEGEEMAFALGNRGAIKFNADGTLDEDIVEAYWRVGFYVFEGALGDEEVIYDEVRIYERSRLIALGIDARQQRFPDESRYVYQPLIGEEDVNRWNEDTRESVLKNYNQRDLGL